VRNEVRQPIPLQPTREGQALAIAVDSRADHSRSKDDSGRQQGADAAGSRSVTIAAGGTAIVHHGLGHEPTGWRVIDRNLAGSVWRTAQDRATLTLETDAAAAITVTVEVF